MRLLLGAQLLPGLCGWFDERGHEARHAQDLPGAPVADGLIADLAARDRLVVKTKYEDFLRLRSPDRFQLFWLRCGNITNRALRAWLDARWEVIEPMLAAGKGLIELR